MNKTYTLNEYLSLGDNSNTPRIEVYRGNDTATKLIAHHKQNCIIVSVADCISNAADLPMPHVLIPELDAKIQESTHRVVVTGIDSYLLLLDKQRASEFIVGLRKRIDENRLNVTYMISKERFVDGEFSAPKYHDTLSVVFIGDIIESYATPIITVVSKKWVEIGSNADTWGTLITKLGQFIPVNDCTLVLETPESPQAGLSDCVMQLFEITDIAEKYYNISTMFPQSVLEELIIKCKSENSKPLEVLQKTFGENNANVKFAIKRLVELRNDTLWEAYVWYIQKSVKADSYLSFALQGKVTKDNLMRKYIVESAVKCFGSEKANHFAAERAATIKEIGVNANSLIIEFIGVAKEHSNDDVALWLNCDTEAERIEIVRRVSESDLTIGLPKIWSGLYSALEAYLSDEFDFDNAIITEYFREYRCLKIKNSVTEDFTQRSANTALPYTFVYRDTVLQSLSEDKNTALLIVDGMGAEYYPLVLSMAKQRGMNIESSSIAQVRLPSSTEFNAVKWNERRCLKPNIYRIDTISHEGAKRHERCTAQQNIVATLEEFNAVFLRISAAFNDYERVVVTADHGSSRLAVLAQNQNFAKKIAWNGEIEDGRYVVAPNNTVRPSNFEQYYDADKNITYWVVRGYGYFRHSNGQSVHGGATLEESLVPIIVFSKAKITEKTQKAILTTVAEQLIEKSGFDDI